MAITQRLMSYCNIVFVYFQDRKSKENNDSMVCSLDVTIRTFIETCNDTEMNSTFNFSLEEAYKILWEHKNVAGTFDKNTTVIMIFFYYNDVN